MKTAAIYARVSSDKQKEEHTIASQTAGLIAFAQSNGYSVPPEWVFEDEGYSGASLVRPGLEKIRDLAAEGHIEAVLIHSPDRLSRKYAYQVLLIEEFSKSGVEAVFLKAPQAETAEDRLLLQFQGMIAEYERAQILERSRRGKRGTIAPYSMGKPTRGPDNSSHMEIPVKYSGATIRCVMNRTYKSRHSCKSSCRSLKHDRRNQHSDFFLTNLCSHFSPPQLRRARRESD